MEKRPPRPPGQPPQRPTSLPDGMDDEEVRNTGPGPLISQEAMATVVAASPSFGFEAWLEVEQNGRGGGPKVLLGGGTTVIGRSSKCELPLKSSDGVSRRHCKVQFVDNTFVVVDLESRNGTRVNGVHVDRKALHDGDLIEVGDERIRFISRLASAAPPPPGKPQAIDQQQTALILMDGGKPGVAEMGLPPLAAERSSTSGRERAASSSGRSRPQQPPDATSDFPIEPYLTGSKTERSPQANDSATVRRSRARGTAPVDESSYVIKAQPARSSLTTWLIGGAGLCTLLFGVAAWDMLAGEQRLVTWLVDTPVDNATELEPVSAPSDGSGPKPTTDSAPETKREAEQTGKPEEKLSASAAAQPQTDRLAPTAADSGTPTPADTPAPRSVNAQTAQVTETTSAPAGATGAKSLEPRAEPQQRQATTREPTAMSSTSGAGTTVAAASGGRIGAVRVRVGQTIARGDVVATLEPQGNVRKKLEARRAEALEFLEAVQQGNTSAQRDLEDVQREIARLEARAQGASLRSSHAGVVLEVLVEPGATVNSGDALIRVR